MKLKAEVFNFHHCFFYIQQISVQPMTFSSMLFGVRILGTLFLYFFRNVALPFRWKLYKPFFRCPVSPGSTVQSMTASSQARRTLEDHGVFYITPNMGTLPPHQSVDFLLEFAPREVSCLLKKKIVH